MEYHQPMSVLLLFFKPSFLIHRKGLLRSSGKEGAVKRTMDRPASSEGQGPMKCPAETDGAKLYLKRFVRLLLDVSNLNVCMT